MIPVEARTIAVAELNESVKVWQRQTLARGQHNRTFFLPSVIVDCTIDRATFSAAWITFEHVSIEVFDDDGCWKSGTFCYRLWVAKPEDVEPREVKKQEMVVTRRPETLTSMDAVIASLECRITGVSIDGSSVVITEETSGTTQATRIPC